MATRDEGTGNRGSMPKASRDSLQRFPRPNGTPGVDILATKINPDTIIRLDTEGICFNGQLQTNWPIERASVISLKQERHGIL